MGIRQAMQRWRHRGADELVCRDVVELVTDYLEGALDERQRRRFEQHIAGCSGCHAYIDQVRAASAALGHLHAEAPTGDVRASLIEAFRSYQRD